MKPDGVGGGDMEDEDWDPQQLFEGMGFLIMEARVPHEATAKGRVEGPHCPPIQWENTHMCSKLSKECRRAEQVRQQMALLWRNGIPMCIEVVLYPDCSHGAHEAEMLMTDGGAMGLVTDENHVLLERWNIHVKPKRHMEKSEGCVTPRFLLQAVRSYLHFSQLSAWLCSTKGNLPNTIIYRLYAPGELGGDSFNSSDSTDVHSFPPADLAQVTAMVSVEALSRVHSIPTILCKYASPGASHSAVKGRMTREEEEWASIKLRLSQSEGAMAKEGRDRTKNNPHTKRKSGGEKGSRMHMNVCSQPAGPKPEFISGNQIFDQNANSGGKELVLAKPKVKLKPLEFTATPMPNTAKGRNLLFQGSMSKRKDSPKVLITSSSNVRQTFYKKRYLDFDNPDEKERFGENSELWEAGKLVSKFGSGYVPQRNTAEELEAYLATIAERGMWKAEQMKQIPVTKCKFFIGEEADEALENKSRTSLSDTPKSSLRDELAAYDELCKTLYHQKLCDLQQRVRETTPERSDSKKDERCPTADSSFTCFREKYPVSPENVPHVLPQREKASSPSHSKLVPAFQGEITLLCPPDSQSNSVASDTHSVCDAKPVQTKLCDAERLTDKAQTAPGDLDQLIMHGGLTLFGHQSALERMNKISCDATAEAITTQSDLNSNDFTSDVDSNGISSKACTNGFSTEVVSNGVQTERTNSLDVTNGTCIQPFIVHRPTPNCANQGPQPAMPPVSSAAISPGVRCERSHSIYKSLLKGDFPQPLKNGVPSQPQISSFREALHKSASMIFNTNSGLPTRSSPAPIKKKSSGKFDYDSSLTNARAIKNAISCSKLSMKMGPSEGEDHCDNKPQHVLSTSAPASTNSLLGNFEESVLNGRIEPVGVVEGFTAEIGASGSFCPKHITLAVTSYFFSLSDDNAPSPYLGHINLETAGKKGYHVPKAGTVQVTLFNPNKTVVKMFVVRYDLCDMPPHSQTFLRQRTLYMPVNKDAQTDSTEPSYLRYLIHLRFFSSKSGKIYLHTDMRLIFARDKFEFDPRIANYELRSFTEGPKNPKFSPKR